jgi:hypothetical protein
MGRTEHACGFVTHEVDGDFTSHEEVELAFGADRNLSHADMLTRDTLGKGAGGGRNRRLARSVSKLLELDEEEDCL